MVGFFARRLEYAPLRIFEARGKKGLSERVWLDRMASDDWRALTPLIYAHINPYGTFELNLNDRLYLEAA